MGLVTITPYRLGKNNKNKNNNTNNTTTSNNNNNNQPTNQTTKQTNKQTNKTKQPTNQPNKQTNKTKQNQTNKQTKQNKTTTTTNNTPLLPSVFLSPGPRETPRFEHSNGAFRNAGPRMSDGTKHPAKRGKITQKCRSCRRDYITRNPGTSHNFGELNH